MKAKMFPDECCRCGFCCLSTTCIIGQRVFGISESELCHALVFNNDEATCRLTPYLVPVGDGCCIKAAAYKEGIKFDFASLPEVFKKRAARDVRLRGIVNEVRVGMRKGGEANGKA